MQVYRQDYAKHMPKAVSSAKAGAEGPRGAMKGGDATGDRPKGEGLRLGGARGVWLRERKAAPSAAVQWRGEGVLPALRLWEKFRGFVFRTWRWRGTRRGVSKCGPGQFRILGRSASALSAGIIGISLQARPGHILKDRIRVLLRFSTAGCNKLSCMHALGNKE